VLTEGPDRVRNEPAGEEPVAVLFQAGPSPPVDGVAKPMKPGGYRDSGADIAFNLCAAGIPVIFPGATQNPSVPLDWVFPDTADGIDAAMAAGARVLWANTVLYEGHPVERGLALGLCMVGQSPATVHRFDDKWHTNAVLARDGLPVARSALVAVERDQDALVYDDLGPTALAEVGLDLPLIVKPVRGRGSEGVVRVDTLSELRDSVARLLSTMEGTGPSVYPRYGKKVMLEEYLPGDEITVNVMPPGDYVIGGRSELSQQHWALTPVRRFSHRDGVAPYSGTVAVTRNSQLLDEVDRSCPAVTRLLEQCVRAAALVGALAPIRIDCRAGPDGELRLFDLNMKPNVTGPGRPGRDDQDGLLSMAGHGIGWTYEDLVVNMLRQRWPSDHESPAA